MKRTQSSTSIEEKVSLQGGNFLKICEECSSEFSARRSVQRWCSKECQHEGKKRYERDKLQTKEGHREYRKENKKRWVKDNPERHKELNRRSRVNTKESRRDKRYQTEYGITTEIYNQILEAQGGGCAICEKKPQEGKMHFHVDHAHSASKYIPAGAVRGILCGSCNHRFIGRHTNPDLFEKAVDYLKTHTGYIVPENKIKSKRRRRKKKGI